MASWPFKGKIGSTCFMNWTKLHQMWKAELITCCWATHNPTGWDGQPIHWAFRAGTGSSWTSSQVVVHLPCYVRRKVRVVSETVLHEIDTCSVKSWNIFQMRMQNTCLMRFKLSIFQIIAFYCCIPWIQGLSYFFTSFKMLLVCIAMHLESRY